MAVIKGGDKLEMRLREIAAKVKNPGTLNVGFLENATYPDGTPVAMVAAIQEFGAPKVGIPPRPYFRGMVARESGHWGGDLGKLVKAKDYDARAALALMGEDIRGELQQSITELTEPPLKQSTIDRKGFDKPLIDTSHMLNSVDYDILPGGAEAGL